MKKAERGSNDFGKFCRVLRIKNDIILKDMSDVLGVSPSYLSAVENGKRKIPNEWGKIIQKNFFLDSKEREDLKNIIDTQDNSFFENFKVDSSTDRAMLVQLARKCQNITSNEFEQILHILNKEDRK